MRYKSAAAEVNFHSYDPAEGHRLPHDPFKAVVAPRPIGWISSIDLDGNVNLAPYSFFNAFSSNPPIIGFASEGRKDTLNNIEITGEFVFNLVSYPLVAAMNQTSGSYSYDVDEFKVAGLRSLPATKVKPPRVAASPASLECRCTDLIQLRGADGTRLDDFLVLGQVVYVHLNKAFLRGGLFDTVAAQSVARCGYQGDYSKSRRIIPPKAAGLPMIEVGSTLALQVDLLSLSGRVK